MWSFSWPPCLQQYEPTFGDREFPCPSARLFNQLNPSTAGVLGLLTMRLWELPIIIAMSCAIGALGALFVALNSRVVHALRQRYISQASRARCADWVCGVSILCMQPTQQHVITQACIADT